VVLCWGCNRRFVGLLGLGLHWHCISLCFVSNCSLFLALANQGATAALRACLLLRVHCCHRTCVHDPGYCCFMLTVRAPQVCHPVSARTGLHHLFCVRTVV
jgi:hypothetical protein